ncbi:hypothetical protein [Ideonella sp.]|uniref:hypothetical protein n=1 Tax=Ideonella sp. TaxID=1929293 RepID=UPI00351B6A75
MQTIEVQVPDAGGGPGMPLLAAADLQDHLMVASNDLERLQRLLDDASETLSGHFYGASSQLTDVMSALKALPDLDGSMHVAMQNLAGAITALQFHDMATQLICHTQKRLRSCADRIARDAMGDEDEDGMAIVEDGPGRPNPVTQDEMDAGSIDLF